ncbi:SlyX family protein [Halomonas garicola]|uniref:SlyX family protein n=1 Tax=Halomonas garicola TaxID=1690008 RepID=UPI0028A1E655|nr:SlyX family protein [Halomonas garicola]
MPHDLSPAALGARLDALESRLAFQEDWLDTLDQAVIEQQRRLQALEELSALMRERLREYGRADSDAAGTAGSGPEHEVPPHY